MIGATGVLGKRWLAAIGLALAIGGCAKPDASIPVGTAAYEVVPAPAPASQPREYRIGALDTLSIAVFQEPDLTIPSLVVDTGGTISVPLIGNVRALGLTTTELAAAIAAKLDRYLVRPQVTVSVVNAVSQKVTVDGSVEQPGVYAIQGRTTLIDALAMAKGTSRVAALDEVIVFREIEGRPAAARFNIKEIRMGRQPNPEILGNDTVVVGFSNIKGVYRDIVGSAALLSSFIYLAAR